MSRIEPVLPKCNTFSEESTESSAQKNEPNSQSPRLHTHSQPFSQQGSAPCPVHILKHTQEELPLTILTFRLKSVLIHTPHSFHHEPMSSPNVHTISRASGPGGLQTMWKSFWFRDALWLLSVFMWRFRTMDGCCRWHALGAWRSEGTWENMSRKKDISMCSQQNQRVIRFTRKFTPSGPAGEGLGASGSECRIWSVETISMVKMRMEWRKVKKKMWLYFGQQSDQYRGHVGLPLL